MWTAQLCWGVNSFSFECGWLKSRLYYEIMVACFVGRSLFYQRLYGRTELVFFFICRVLLLIKRLLLFTIFIHFFFYNSRSTYNKSVLWNGEQSTSKDTQISVYCDVVFSILTGTQKFNTAIGVCPKDRFPIFMLCLCPAFWRLDTDYIAKKK
jgi:hypothetical protein